MVGIALSIVIPAYDEEARIGATLAATRAYVDARGVDCEIIVVDDGSRDGTAALVDRLSAEDPRVRLLRLGVNRGKGAAVRAGMLAAVGERLLFMDADLATPIEELATLERALDEGADIAIASRATAGANILTHQHPVRETMGKTFNLLVRLVALGGYHDTQCGFKLFRREAAHALFREARVDRFAFDVEILLLARGRYRVAEVPVSWRHVERSKLSPFRDATRMGMDLLWMRAGLVLRAILPRR